MNFGIGWVCAPQFVLQDPPGGGRFGFFLDETKAGVVSPPEATGCPVLETALPLL